MRIKRRRSKKVSVGNLNIGGNSPVAIQSMTTTDTADVSATVAQIKRLEKAGCQIIRVSVLNDSAARAINRIKKKINIPLVADIHFDYRLAVLAIENQADKIRLNPGNIKKRSDIEKVVKLAKARDVPIRIGLNSGSVTRISGRGLVSDMINAALYYEKIFRRLRFNDTVFSFKTPDVLTTVEAYRKFARHSNAPLHLGLTATGLEQDGLVKSSIGIGALLLEGIGDTLRVSLTADPLRELEAAKKILSALGLRSEGIEIIACPTCGRCSINLIDIVKKTEQALKPLERKFKQRQLRVAIMGCVVNGPQEAKDADIGIAWGGKSGVLFRKGKKIRIVKEREIIKTLLAEVKNEVV